MISHAEHVWSAPFRRCSDNGGRHYYYLKKKKKIVFPKELRDEKTVCMHVPKASGWLVTSTVTTDVREFDIRALP